MFHMIDPNKIVLSDSNKISFHIATAEYRGKIVASRPNRAGEHAEIGLLKSHALRSYRNKKINVYVTRLSKNGHAMSRPCQSCSRYIKAYWPLACIYYTNADGDWHRDDALDTEHLCLSDRMALPELTARRKPRRPRSNSGSGSSSSDSNSSESDSLCEECQ